ncbi:30S ribosomal protein S2 [candidate division MSBL1 archaeon SCGC-AAA382N08]|uniref:30S ribosomal protein S2 n=1 Tax=candidate division MSBL1 archaeon SCGC-AAA382N08 TaxID=1698285 RepID=A0A133VQX5_9EURY|nr:30S ribosomal protein S2 [candidate division MSBL1 archaeon SCGC-AAA382N08]
MAEQNDNLNVELDPEQMVQQGVHFGHSPSKLHPEMERYLYGIRNTINIIDLEQTAEKLKQALSFIKQLKEEDRTLLVVGTKIQVQDLTEEFAKQGGFPYVNERWIGGTFTNFDNISERIEYLKELEQKREEGEFEKYTKKEKADKEEEIEKLQRKFGGLKSLNGLPDAVLVLHMRKDDLAVREAQKKGVKIIGIADTNVDPTQADYPIPANDDAITSVQYILDKIEEVV